MHDHTHAHMTSCCSSIVSVDHSNSVHSNLRFRANSARNTLKYEFTKHYKIWKCGPKNIHYQEPSVIRYKAGFGR